VVDVIGQLASLLRLNHHTPWMTGRSISRAHMSAIHAALSPPSSLQAVSVMKIGLLVVTACSAVMVGSNTSAKAVQVPPRVVPKL
jgi:hypothetical protein